ncbi:MAG: hypothetical protein CMI55_03595 [Parcubacteria group bacterium]|jgi:hypothetical protein|nr:hypothetical protein [Parcubacteria group bacterium]|tara:strand:+ start:6018 stop:6251 length:234 start_codon:yes stop_codon:yes gene_type:complete
MWEKIKKILQKQGGKCIIIEDNQPSYLVMKLDDYEKNAAGEVEKVNQDIAQWEADEKKEKQASDLESQEVKIEDLPF